jgi:DNA-binding transcriptional MerR regulator
MWSYLTGLIWGILSRIHYLWKGETEMVNKKLLSSQEVSKRYNLTYGQVNYYTNLGLLSVVGNKGNKRLYNDRVVKAHIKKIKEMKRKGYSLRSIRAELLSKRRG